MLNQPSWSKIAWSELEENVLLSLCSEIWAQLPLYLIDEERFISIYADQLLHNNYKIIIDKQTFDDPTRQYLRICGDEIKYKRMLIAEFEKSIVEGGLGRFGPEIQVALDKQIRQKEELVEKLVKTLTIICSELFIEAIQQNINKDIMDEYLKLTIADVEHRISLIKIHKQICAILEIQLAHFGSFAPPYMQADYDKRQEEIKRQSHEIVDTTKNMPANGIEALSSHLEMKMPEKIVISDSNNVLVNTRINAGGDVIILHITNH